LHSDKVAFLPGRNLPDFSNKPSTFELIGTLLTRQTPSCGDMELCPVFSPIFEHYQQLVFHAQFALPTAFTSTVKLRTQPLPSAQRFQGELHIGV